MNELRWILIAASVVLLIWIYWQGRRKGLVADNTEPIKPEPPQLQESAIVRERRDQLNNSHVVIPAHSELNSDDLPEVRIAPQPSEPKLSMEAALSTSALEKLAVTQSLPQVEVPIARAQAAEQSTVTIAKQRTPRRVVALRVSVGAQQMSGDHLSKWLADHDLRYGKYDIFHRYDEHGDVLFSIASMVEPGTFDRAAMANTDYKGVSLFLQLPSAVDGVAAFDEMLACAFTLQKDFAGDIFGERNLPLTGELAERMRESVANFQHLSATSPGSG